MKTNIHFLSYLARFFLEWKMFQTKVVGKIKTLYFTFNNLKKKWDNVEKCGRAEQVTDDNMAHAHCMLGTYGYTHSLTVCNAYCFFHCNNGCMYTPERYVTVHCLYSFLLSRDCCYKVLFIVCLHWDLKYCLLLKGSSF